MTRVTLVAAVTLAVFAQAQPPKFEVASIKPCDGKEVEPERKSGGRGDNFSPGTFREECTTVMSLIKQAYVLFANGHVNPRSRIEIEGGPAWIRSDLYRIDARAPGPQPQGMMYGPMLQALLQDRLKLKLRRDTREVPAYALTVAKGGPKLHAFREGTCIPFDLKLFEQFPPPPFPKLPPGQEYCGGKDPKDGSRWVAAMGFTKGPSMVLEARAMSIDDFIKHSLEGQTDRPVVNKTGISGLFDFHLEFAPEDAAPSDVTGPSIFTALQQQLGLKLEPAKAPGEFLVIDHVERPSAN